MLCINCEITFISKQREGVYLLDETRKTNPSTWLMCYTYNKVVFFVNLISFKESPVGHITW